MTMSDWFGTYSTVEALKAGLDLEMPGGPIFRGTPLTRAIASGKLQSSDLDTSATRVSSGPSA
jgi:beta-glucosidase